MPFPFGIKASNWETGITCHLKRCFLPLTVNKSLFSYCVCAQSCLTLSDQIADIRWIIKKTREFQKSICFCFIDYTKAFDCVDHKKLENLFKRWAYQTTWPASWEICMQVKKQQLELDMEKQTGSNLGKEYVKAVYCHPAYMTHLQNTSWEMLDWMKHKLESRLLGEI